MDHRLGQGQALPPPAGKVPRQGLGVGPKAKAKEGLLRQGPGLPGTVEPGPEKEVFLHGEVAVNALLLGGVADARLHPVRSPRHVQAGHLALPHGA